MKIFTSFFIVLFIGLSLGISARNGPVATLGTVSTKASSAIVPLTVSDFNNIKSFDLKISYNPYVAAPLTITKGADLNGALSFYTGVPGEIQVIWNAPAASVSSLNDGAVLINIAFSQVNSGTSELIFDESADIYDCQFYDADYTGLNDIPAENSYITGSLTFESQVSPVITAPAITNCAGEALDVPVTVTGFNNIGAVSLTLNYDPNVLTFNSGSNTANFPGLIFGENVPGTIKIGGISNSAEGFTLPDESVLFTLRFTHLEGSTDLSWNDDGESCEFNSKFPDYDALDDTPQSSYYINGHIKSCPVIPAIAIGTIINPVACGSNGTIPLVLTNVPDGLYAITYDDGTFPDVDVLAGVAEISAPAGTYNNLQIMVDGEVSELGVNAVINDPEAPDAPVTGIPVQPTCSVATGSVELTGLPAGSWTIDPGNISGTGSNYNVTGLIPGTYNFTVTNANGCISPASEDVIIKEQPMTPDKPDLDVIQPNCEIATGTIRIMAPTETENTFSINGVDYQVSNTFSGLIPGTYSVSVMNADGCTSPEVNTEIYEQPLTPSIPVITASGPALFCEGDSVVLTSGEASTYLWSTGETMQSITVKITGSYTVTITNNEGCNAVSEAVDVTVNPKPAIPDNLKCWESAKWDPSVCSWVISGTKPPEPVKENCWDNYLFNEATCSWENQGTEPDKPESVNCWDDYQFNNTSCEWQNIGYKPLEPISENCWDNYIFNNITCSWDNQGQKPLQPTPENSWDVFVFNTFNCVWENIGTPTDAQILEHAAKINMVCYPNPFRETLKIKYNLPEDGHVSLELIGITGNRIKSISNQNQMACEYTIEMNSEKIDAGVYQVIFRFKDSCGDEVTKSIRTIKH